MYTKSEEEVSAVLQILPETFKSRFGEELNLQAVRDHIVKTLDKSKAETIERQFSGWNTESLLAMLKVIDKLSNQPAIETIKKKKSK